MDALLYHVKPAASLGWFKNKTKAAAGGNAISVRALLQFQYSSNCACCSLGVNGKLIVTATTMISNFK